MSSIFKHNLRSVPKSWIKQKGRRYAIPKEKLKDFGGPHGELGYRMVQIKLTRQLNREHAALMGMLDELRARIDQECGCRVCKWVKKVQGGTNAKTPYLSGT